MNMMKCIFFNFIDALKSFMYMFTNTSIKKTKELTKKGKLVTKS
jgi:hypothetical protein